MHSYSVQNSDLAFCDFDGYHLFYAWKSHPEDVYRMKISKPINPNRSLGKQIVALQATDPVIKLSMEGYLDKAL